MNQPLIVILNPNSGTSDEDFRAEIEAQLKASHTTYEIRETTEDRGADVLAREAVCDGDGEVHIVACGGDGTVMAAVNGIGKAKATQSEKSATLSIIPGGTANLLATALKIPTEVKDAVQIAVSGRTREIDLGRCGKELFALGLGMGLTERMISQTSAQEKERLGRWAYVKAALKELGQKPTAFSYRLDDGPLQNSRGVAIVVANSGDIGGKLKFAPDALMDDGKLDLCILHHCGPWDVVRMVARSLWGDINQDRAVSFLQAAKIEVRSAPPLDLQIDGEEVEMQTPLVAEVQSRALKITVPPEPATATTSLVQEAAQVVTEKRSRAFVVAAALPLVAVISGVVWWVWKRKK